MIESVLVAGLFAAGFALLFRALPWPSAWLASKHWFWRKLWDCAACAGGRAAIPALFVLLPEWPGWRSATLFYFGAAAIGSVLYHYVRPPPIDLDLGGLGE